MPLSSKDFDKGLDITAQIRVSGSELNQLVDVARTALGRGLTIVTQDIALNVPEVPNPNLPLEGVTPLWWKNYLWIRKPFDNTGNVIGYFWNEFINSDPTYLGWVAINVDILALQAQYNMIAEAIFGDRLDISILQQYRVIDSGNISSNSTSIGSLQTSLSVITASILASIANICPSGSLRWSASASVNSQWLLCDGTSYARAAYPSLFTAIGVTYGSTDAFSFNVPDYRGRALFNIGQGVGINNITLNQKGGENSHLLTGRQSGIQSHQHNLPSILQLFLDNLQNGSDGGVKANASSPVKTDFIADTPALDPLSLMPPFVGACVLIKI